MSTLQTIVELSHEFGTPVFVHGGGGNSSCKTDDTLWVKPSGTTLQRIEADDFVALDRAGINELYDVETPPDASAREKLVKEIMTAAVLPESSGRPSVEAPLHNSFHATYVVHTHPTLVNGMTCARDGETACKKLFPEALWMPYVDPGYSLCMRVRESMKAYEELEGHQPPLLFIQNHGVFVAADTAAEIRKLYSHVMGTLAAEYERTGTSTELNVGPEPPEEKTGELAELARDTIGEDDAAHVVPGGVYAVAEGPVSPDHIVYSKSFPLVGLPTQDAVDRFREQHGYSPRIVACAPGVFGLGRTRKNAALALELSRDAALVKQLADAFGGIRFMSDEQRRFIESWEVEAYRQRIAEA